MNCGFRSMPRKRSVFQMVRGKDMFDRIVANVVNLHAPPCSAVPNTYLPRASLSAYRFARDPFYRKFHSPGAPPGCDGSLPAENGLSPRRARAWHGLSRHCSNTPRQEEEVIATGPSGGCNSSVLCSVPQVRTQLLGASMKKRKDDSPWSLCRRPWSQTHIAANAAGASPPPAPFSMRGYDSFTLGNATPADHALKSGMEKNREASSRARC